MTAAQRQTRSYPAAVALMTFTAFLVPIVGVVTAPVLARALSPFGRGELAAAMAPAGIMLSLAAMGLPEALTYFLAKAPRATRRLLVTTTLMTLALTGAVVGLVAVASPSLASGRASLADLMTLAAIISVPQLVWGLFRGAAAGRQIWWPIVVERVANALLRVGLLVGFAWHGTLTVMSALLITILVPSATGLVYLVILRRSYSVGDSLLEEDPGAFDALRFGAQIWLGSVIAMLISRTSQLVLAPLSDESELGLFVVAVTLSDVILVMVSAVQGTLFSVASREFDVERAQMTSRISLVVTLAGSALFCASFPWTIPLLFGDEYIGAVPVSWLMVSASVVSVPGLIAGVALNALGRPMLRSLALVAALIVNVVLLFVLAPPLGAVGAGLSALTANLVVSGVLVAIVARSTGTDMSPFVVLRRSDLAVCWALARRISGTLMHRRGKRAR